MTNEQRQIVLLGPQPEYATLKTALSKLNLQLPVALVTAGWETDEQEDEQVKQELAKVDVDCVNLKLFSRTEQLFAGDAELIQTLQSRQDELRHLRSAYNDRLQHLLKSARQIIRRQDKLIDLSIERESAIDMVRQLDRQYFVRTCQIIDDYENRLKTAERPLVVKHREEIARTLEKAGAIVISGGHVAIILNRLKIFGILEMQTSLPLIAWSGGTMALANQIVVFHDSPPQGPGNPEVLRAGMGIFNNLLPLPDAKTRLRLSDKARVELFARRFGDFQCVVLDEQTILERNNGNWISTGADPADRLGAAGGVERLNA